MPGDARLATKRAELWADVDDFQQSGGWDETREEARDFAQGVKDEISWKLISSRDKDLHPISQEVAGANDAPFEQPESSKSAAERAARLAAPHLADVSSAPSEAPPSFHPSHALRQSTPRTLHTATFPIVPTPSDTGTPVLPRPRPLASASTSALIHPHRITDTPEQIASPIETPDTSRTEGRGRRDDPTTPVPIGTGSFAKLKTKKDFQTISKHFDLFSKNISKTSEVAKGRGGRKVPGRGGSSLAAGLGGKIFEGLRFCIPPELGKVGQHKGWWEIVRLHSGIER